VYQGPRQQGDLYIGPDGRWNDTAIPRVRYMNQTVGGGDHWQMTYAEGRGGIDGMHHGGGVRGITYCWPLTCAARTHFFLKIFIAQTVHTVCTRINYKTVPVASLNKYLHHGKLELN
jgi:hypothetical protein